jgi:hypothetical protein
MTKLKGFQDLLDSQNAERVPHRVQLSRKSGWRMPGNTIKVDRTTPLGNPFIVGKHGTVKECILLFEMLCSGLICASVDAECVHKQKLFLEYVKKNKEKLKDKNFACWCRLSSPCHSEPLLRLINGGVAHAT